MMAIDDQGALLAKQRAFFQTQSTLPVEFRIQQLKKLQRIVEKHSDDLVHALKLDLRKPETETLLGELVLFHQEIQGTIKQLKKWCKPKYVSSKFLATIPGRSFIVSEPYGVVLIISPWNYPFLLTFGPLIGAIAAGNCVTVKPSELTPKTAELMAQIIRENFAPEFISVITGDATVVTELLKNAFDYIFFTGSPQIGKVVMRAASEHLTPVTLELGGKSPCIVDASASIPYAARRIMWAKFLNAGQTCIAPDYLFVQESVRAEFLKACLYYLKQFYGQSENANNQLTHIVNEKHFDRLSALVANEHCLTNFSSDRATLYMAPTLLGPVQLTSPIMQEEIFGPLLPIVTFKDIQEVIVHVRSQAKPLALYCFTHDEKNKQRIIKELSFGGGCINDCITHMANPMLPFGGVGTSGMGSYHGKKTFLTFSHQKSIYCRWFSFDMSLQYPPYTPTKLRWLKRLLQLF